MLRYFIISLIIFIAGCEAVPIKNVNEIQTESSLNRAIHLPVNVSVAIYVDSSKPDNGVNFYGKMVEAAKLVSSEYFSEADDLKAGSKFQYLLKFKTKSEWESGWGRWKSVITAEIMDNQGKSLYNRNLEEAANVSTIYDFSAVFNSLAKAVKIVLIDFMNQQGNENLKTAELAYEVNSPAPLPIKILLKDLKPSSSGSGFYIDHDGTVVTANHVVQDCLYAEVRYKENTFSAAVQQNSRLLDIAILNTEIENTPFINISENAPGATLGKNVFVTGYPLQGILSDSPTLTIGTVSSLGGLKGSKGTFMFSAPVQPGNSGSPIVDYSGNLIGMVSSTLNQKMLLEKLDVSSQNANFGIDLMTLKKFLTKNDIAFSTSYPPSDFETASKQSVTYSTQVLCYK